MKASREAVEGSSKGVKWEKDCPKTLIYTYLSLGGTHVAAKSYVKRLEYAQHTLNHPHYSLISSPLIILITYTHPGDEFKTKTIINAPIIIDNPC